MISAASPENQPAELSDDSTRSVLLAYLQLFRLPNLFTAMAEVTMGYLFVHVSLEPVGVYVSLLGASCLLYTAGMVLNDVYDVQVDARERPQRPLPSGRISISLARRLGFGMLLLGLGLGWSAGYVSNHEGIIAWHSGAVVTALAACVVLYDAVLKVTSVGPLLMGTCRMLNVLLGMSVAVPPDQPVWQWLGFDVAQLMVAGGIGLYIVGVTWFARSEATLSNRLGLVVGVGLMMMGLTLLAIFPNYGAFGAGTTQLTMRSPIVWPLLVALLTFSIVRRCAVAIVDPQPSRVQLAVKQCIFSLIVLDAAICLAVRTPLWWSIAVLCLMFPMLLLGKWVYST